MALDTRYRPLKYGDVLGQEATVTVLKQFVHTGTGFHQSYLFCGAHGSGKTTLGRILARALLCEHPVNGEPCDECESCRAILEKGTSECFVEMDAATKSGKENITRITEELQYSTVSGKRRIYLFDEAHRLSREARDALLKPMEESVSPGSDDKQLVCIFCTTEPEKMQVTVFSRCAPAFTIRVVTPEVIAERLVFICTQEGIPFEREALVTIAEVTECHIRDGIKAIEGVSMLGGVTAENVARYYRLDTNESLLKILALIGSDVGQAMKLAQEVCQVVSPSSAYTRLAEACMLAYRVHLGVAKAPVYWKPQFVAKLGEHHQDFLLTFAQGFASRPGRPTASMLVLDIARLHQLRTGTRPVAIQSPPIPPPEPVKPIEVPSSGTQNAPVGTSAPSAGKVDLDPPRKASSSAGTPRTGTYEPVVNVDPRGVKKRDRSEPQETAKQVLGPAAFREALSNWVAELTTDGRNRGSPR